MDWDGNGVADGNDEWVELYNPQDMLVDISGWFLDDGAGGSRPYEFPTGTVIPAHGFLVVYKQETGVALNNGGDSVRLLSPSKRVVDAVTYSKTKRTDATTWARVTDGYGAWTDTYPPSPGAPNRPPTPVPSPTPRPPSSSNPGLSSSVPPMATPPPFVAINEFLPAPSGTVDWDGDGWAGGGDEWVELYNPNGHPVDISGWRLDDREGGSRPYVIPQGTFIASQGFLVFYKRETGISLNNSGDKVRLLAPDGRVVDEVSYGATARTDDFSWSRERDGVGAWTDTYPPTPGGPNQPGRVVEVASLARVRTLPKGTRVALEGVVILPPGWVSARAMYVGSRGEGLRVYMPWLKEKGVYRLGDKVRLVGTVGEYRNEIEVVVRRKADIRVETRGANIPAVGTSIAHVGYRAGGLVRVVGRISRRHGKSFYVRVGKARARVYAPSASGYDTARLRVGTWVRVTGVVTPYRGKWQIVIRGADDVMRVDLAHFHFRTRLTRWRWLKGVLLL